MSSTTSNQAAVGFVREIIEKARKAQREVEFASQETVNMLSTAIAWELIKEDNVKLLAKTAYEETTIGDYESKYNKLIKKVKGCLRDIKDLKTVGIVEEVPEKGIKKIAKPVGIIGSLVPVTNPEVTPATQALFAIKGRNAVIFSPHPKGKKTTFKTVELMRKVLKKRNAPEDLLICIENPTKEIIDELMRQCDLVLATGGSAMVKAAYSSGTPAYGVGVGNAVIVIDETADIKDAAQKIRMSKTFDLASGCSSENSLVINNSIYDKMLDALNNEGGYLLNREEKKRLQDIMWADGHLNPNIIAKPVKKIAELAGIKCPDNCKFLMVEEEGTGKEHPFSGEKLSVVLTLYRYSEFKEAIELVNAIHSYQGAGHSCGIHSFNEENILQLSLNTRTSRVMVRQAHVFANSGDWCNGMPFTVSLGCGTWGGNIVSENICMKHYLNITWVSTPFDPIIPSDEELFGNIMYED